MPKDCTLIQNIFYIMLLLFTSRYYEYIILLAAVDTTSYVYNKKRIQYMAGVVETMFKNPPAKSTDFDDELKLTKGMCITSRMRQNFMKG